MYRKHFGFTRYPFDQPLEPAELFASTAITEAQARLKHLIELRGIGLITGASSQARCTAGCSASSTCRSPQAT